MSGRIDLGGPEDTWWRGFRRVLNCGHRDLCDVGYEGLVGQLAECRMCPLTTHNPARPGIPSVPVRQIVAIDPVQASQPPAVWPPEHWHGGS